MNEIKSVRATIQFGLIAPKYFKILQYILKVFADKKTVIYQAVEKMNEHNQLQI